MPTEIMNAYTYILRCADGTYYTGWTNDLAKRLLAHNAGTGAKYTRGRTPVTLVYCEEFTEPTTARQRECQIKQLSRAQKQQLIRSASVDRPDTTDCL